MPGVMVKQTHKEDFMLAWILFKTIENETEKADLTLEKNPNDR